MARTLLQRAEAAVAEHRGRVVKSIGDAVMFTTADPVAAAAVALDIVEDVAADPAMPPVRAAVTVAPLTLPPLKGIDGAVQVVLVHRA